MTTKPIDQMHNLYDVVEADEKLDAYIESVTDSETGCINVDPEAMFAVLDTREELDDQLETVVERFCKSIRNGEHNLKRLGKAKDEVSEKIAELVAPLLTEIDGLSTKEIRIRKDIDFRKGALRHFMVAKDYKKLDTGTFKLGIRTTKSVFVPDDADLKKWSLEFVSIKRAVDKKELKIAMDAGKKVPDGVRFTETKTLKIT